MNTVEQELRAALTQILEVIELSPNSECCNGDPMLEYLDSILLDIEDRARIALYGEGPK